LGACAIYRWRRWQFKGEPDPPRKVPAGEDCRDTDKKNLKIVIIFDIHYALPNVNISKSHSKQPVNKVASALHGQDMDGRKRKFVRQFMG
jgi:hypothetical protein